MRTTGVGSRVYLLRVIVAISYAALGGILIWSRLYGLDRGGICCDEIATVVNFVRPGPWTILAGDNYTLNNHELFSLLAWAASWLNGETAVALRLFAAVPFVLGVGMVTTWLHLRLGALSGLIYLFLATASPLLIDLSRQARGYGLAFFAMSIVVVAAVEALRSHRRLAVAAFCIGGIVGMWTLPHFAIAFLAIGAVLIAVPELRTRVAVGLVVSSAATALWYAPHLDGIFKGSRQDYAVEISSTWLVTAPIDQILVPAMFLSGDDYLHPNLASLALVSLFVVTIASSPLLRTWTTALVLVIGIVATTLAVWATGTYAAPRFFSFLLVPLLVLVATGAAAVLGKLPSRRPTLLTATALAVLVLVAFVSVPILVASPLQPRVATRQAVDVIRTAPATRAVLAYIRYPDDLAFHLGRAVQQLKDPPSVRRVCTRSEPVILVVQVWLLEPATLPCARRDGVQHHRFDQSARGGATDVWFVPPAGASS